MIDQQDGALELAGTDEKGAAYGRWRVGVAPNDANVGMIRVVVACERRKVEAPGSDAPGFFVCGVGGAPSALVMLGLALVRRRRSAPSARAL